MSRSARESAASIAAPFAVGELLDYSISFGPIHVGTGRMELEAGDAIRGMATYHATFTLRGGPSSFASTIALKAGSELTTSAHCASPSTSTKAAAVPSATSKSFRSKGSTRATKIRVQTVAESLDDGSFLYFVRTLSLLVGECYEFARYFQPDGNPIVLHVLRTERLSVPAGTFEPLWCSR